jgi:hypothetical protein
MRSELTPARPVFSYRKAGHALKGRKTPSAAARIIRVRSSKTGKKKQSRERQPSAGRSESPQDLASDQTDSTASSRDLPAGVFFATRPQ